VRSPPLVSVADSDRVRLWRFRLAWASTQAISAAGCLRSPGWALADSAIAPTACGVAIEVPWMAVQHWPCGNPEPLVNTKQGIWVAKLEVMLKSCHTLVRSSLV
jgi:hypothetical protein